MLSAPKNLEKRQQIRKLQLPGCHLQVSNTHVKKWTKLIFYQCFSESFSSVSLPHWADWQLNTRGKSSRGETTPGAKIEDLAFFKRGEQNAKIV